MIEKEQNQQVQPFFDVKIGWFFRTKISESRNPTLDAKPMLSDRERVSRTDLQVWKLLFLGLFSVWFKWLPTNFTVSSNVTVSSNITVTFNLWWISRSCTRKSKRTCFRSRFSIFCWFSKNHPDILSFSPPLHMCDWMRFPYLEQ